MEEVLYCINKLVNNKLQNGKIITSSDIGVITPYRLQQNFILNGLKNTEGNNIKVGTTEMFQGQERLIIIVWTVRTLQTELGIVKDPHVRHFPIFSIEF